MRMIFIGGGTDAGGWYIGPDGKLHRYPGWNPEQLADLTHAVRGLRELSHIKASGVAENVLGSVLAVVNKELSGHLEAGDVLVFGG